MTHRVCDWEGDTDHLTRQPPFTTLRQTGHLHLEAHWALQEIGVNTALTPLHVDNMVIGKLL